MGAWMQDVRISWRNLARRPGFALTVVATLALGIGATSTIYSVVDAVLLRPLRYRDASTLVAVGNTFPRREWDDQGAGLQHLAGVSVANWLDYRGRVSGLDALAAVEPSSVLMPDRGNGPELVSAARISASFLATLGVAPVLGRDFAAEEHAPGSGAVALLSYGAWVRRFGGDPSVVGSRLGRGDSGAIIVGVLPRDFRAPELFFPSQPDFWLPLQPGDARYADRGRRSLYLVGRLAPGVTVEQAREEARRVAADVAREHPDGNVYPGGEALGLGLNDLRAATVGASRQILELFMGASGLLLLIACLNAATLLLARSLDRARELGVRAALGAGRRTLVRLVVSESLLLAVASGVVGTALAYAGVAAVHRFGPSSIPRLEEIGVDGRILGVTAALTVAVGIGVGLVPALRGGRRAMAAGLSQGQWGTQGRSGARLRAGLVSGQIALAVVLLSSAGLLSASVLHLRGVDPGFDPHGVVTFRMPLKSAQPSQPWQDWDAVLERVAAIPGVQAVGGTSNVPFQSPYWSPWVRLPEQGEEVRESTAGYAVTPGYLQAVRTRLLAGRGFGPGDGPDGPWVALVNEAFVRQRLLGREGGGPSTDAAMRGVLGQELRFTDEEERMVRVVGVVENVIQERAQEGPLPAIYVPYTQVPWPFVQVALRSGLPPSTVAGEVRKAMADLDPSVPVLDLRAMEARMAATRADPRFRSLLIGFFAALALLLASAGLYGSLAHVVSRRRRELGIRVALGAARRGVVALVVGQGIGIAAVGLVLGLAGSLAVSRLLSGFLYGVTPTDPLTYGAVVALLGGVAALASFVPARRATGVDPVEVLRSE